MAASAMDKMESGFLDCDEEPTTADFTRGQFFNRTASRSSKEEMDELVRAARQRVEPAKRPRVAVVVDKAGEVVTVDLHHSRPLKAGLRRRMLDEAMETEDMDNEAFLMKMKQRLDAVGVQLPEVEVRFKGLSVEAIAYSSGRALPSIYNSVRNVAEGALQTFGLLRSGKVRLDVLKDVSGALRAGRLTLLLGPPGCGKSTLLKALAGKLRGVSGITMSGDMMYNGYRFDEFIPERTAGYVSQSDNHIAELTVRETLDFSARCQCAGYEDELQEVQRREAEQAVEPDWDLATFMVAASMRGKRHSIMADYIMRMLGLEVCAETLIGNDMVRGISGGQRKRVTTGEMVVGPKKTLFLDEISTGLDSSTTYQIMRCLQNLVHFRRCTALVALLQPAPETYALFDDVMLLSEGRIVFQGGREEVVPFFSRLGFHLPTRKGTADFLQEVTSEADQQQYWADASRPYRFMSAEEMAKAFAESHLGSALAKELLEPAPRTKKGAAALVHKKYALSFVESLKACFRREITLFNRHRFVYIHRVSQVLVLAALVATLLIAPRMNHTTLDGGTLYLNYIFFSSYFMMVSGFTELTIMVNNIRIFYRQRDDFFFPTPAYLIPSTLLRVPFSLVVSITWAAITYPAVGLAPGFGRFILFWLILFLLHQSCVTLFRCCAAVGRQLVKAFVSGFGAIAVALMFGGFAIPHGTIPPYWVWAYWANPLSYAFRSLAMLEFSAPRWQTPHFDANRPEIHTLGDAVLDTVGLNISPTWMWIGYPALFGFIVIYNISLILAMAYLSYPVEKRAVYTGHKSSTALSKAAEEVQQPSAAAQPKFNSQAKASDAPRFLLANTDSDEQDSPPKRGPQTAGEVWDRTNAEPVRVLEGKHTVVNGGRDCDVEKGVAVQRSGRGLSVLPFEPVVLTFQDICYFVDLPEALAKQQAEGKQPRSWLGLQRRQGREEPSSPRAKPELQLLHSISGMFRPGVLTALMGASGAGKTTLMDVLAGRKTSGRISGDVRVNGYRQDHTTFARISGYCEQFDIHSPQMTVQEALWFSSRLRLTNVQRRAVDEYVEQVMELVELTSLREALVGLPGVSGLSVEQRKRLTIAVELVANPSIVFMDEPTSGLDARAAAIVMRAVRNIVDTGRTICCTIHQPSIDIFEAFDELLLLKRGGEVIYSGSLGPLSADMIAYFSAVPGVRPIPEGYNPATWMLEVSTLGAEERMGADLAEVYRASDLCRQNLEQVSEAAKPVPGVVPLHFDTPYATSVYLQYFLILAKNTITYWRYPAYNSVRLAYTTAFAFLFGTSFWMTGTDRDTRESIMRIAAAQYVAVMTLGFSNAATVQPIVFVERSVFYRERYARLYASLPYAVAQGTVELPWVAAQSLFYSLLVYFLSGFQHSAEKFFMYLVFMFLSLMMYTSFGIMCVALTASLTSANVIATTGYAVWNLMAGFILPHPWFPGWWIWLSYLTPSYYTYNGLIASQLGDVTNEFVTLENGSKVSVASFIEDYFGYRWDFRGYCVLLLVVFIAVFRLTAIFALSRLNFQKR